MTQTLDEILEGLMFIRAKVGLKTSDDILWDSGVRIFNAQSIKGISKPVEKEKEELATDRQKEFLLKNNIDFNAESITKRTAFDLIKKFKEKYSLGENTI